MEKLCECGCGQYPGLYLRTDTGKGHIKGTPRRFAFNHRRRNGGYTTAGSMNYRTATQKDHPRANKGYVLEHILIAERAIGKSLPPQSEVHHFPQYPSDQLVICQDKGYHLLLHVRFKALKACGHADWKKCQFCKQYDAPSNLYYKPRGSCRHRSCHALYEYNRKHTGIYPSLSI